MHFLRTGQYARPQHPRLKVHNRGVSCGEIRAPCLSVGLYRSAVARSFMHSFTGKLRGCDITQYHPGVEITSEVSGIVNGRKFDRPSE